MRVGSTVSTIRGMFSTRPSTRADDLHAISTRHGIDGAILWGPHGIVSRTTTAPLRSSVCARAQRVRPTTRQACRGNIGVLPIVVPVCCTPTGSGRKVAPGWPESCRDTACVSSYGPCIEIHTISIIPEIYIANFYSQTRRSGRISVYDQRPARNFKPVQHPLTASSAPRGTRTLGASLYPYSRAKNALNIPSGLRQDRSSTSDAALRGTQFNA